LLRIYATSDKVSNKSANLNLHRTTSLTNETAGLSEKDAGCEEVVKDLGQAKNFKSELQVIGDYKQSKAFKTLLRRQSQAVSRISRIKESFTKKRMQIHMLAVKQDPNGSKLTANDYDSS
jgi:hypothetical protein